MENELRDTMSQWILDCRWDAIENMIADGNQSKSISEYLKHFLKISRLFGHATNDETWNEFEKEFAIIIKRMLYAEHKNHQLRNALEKARDHLEYCGYGDKWENECAADLPNVIEEALEE